MSPWIDLVLIHNNKHTHLTFFVSFSSSYTQQPKSVVTTPLVVAILIAAITQFLVGYNTGVMNAPVNVVFPGHSLTSWSLAVSAFAIGGPLGASLGGTLADRRGRRGALLIDFWTFVVGGLLQTVAPDMLTIIVSRFIIGVASGCSTVLVPIYLNEMSPASLRGALGSLTQFGVVMGVLLSDVLAFAFATLTLWRVLFFVTALTAGIQLLMSPFLLESPRFLLLRDRKSSKARQIIKSLRGLETDEEVEEEVNTFMNEGGDEKEEESMMALLGEMWSKPRIRLLLIGSLVLNASQQLCGSNAVFYYSTIFFQGVISNPLVGTTILGAVNVAATGVAVLIMDRTGRKTLVLWSAGVMSISCIFIVLALLGVLHSSVSLIALIVYVIFFEIGLGPVPWLIVGEMFETRYVASAMSISSQVNWFNNFLVGFTFPYMNKYLGAYSFGPFSIFSLLCFLYTIFFLPETQGTTPEQLAAGDADTGGGLQPSIEDGGALDQE